MLRELRPRGGQARVELGGDLEDQVIARDEGRDARRIIRRGREHPGADGVKLPAADLDDGIDRPVGDVVVPARGVGELAGLHRRIVDGPGQPPAPEEDQPAVLVGA